MQQPEATEHCCWRPTTSLKELPAAAPNLCTAAFDISGKGIFASYWMRFVSGASCCATRRIWSIANLLLCRHMLVGSFRSTESGSLYTICWRDVSGLDAHVLS